MRDLTKGSPIKLMLLFALPVFLGNLFQLFYSLADTRIVGSILGEASLAAVGSTTAISTLLIGFLQGMTNGFAIITAQSMGAQDTKRLRKSAAATFLLGGIMAVSLTVLVLVFLPLILQLLHVSEELHAQAYAYISIIMAGLVITMLYNACAGLLRAVGDTVAPLLFLVCSTILNVGLDIFFIAVVKLGVRGAALGTVISQLVSVVLSFAYIWKKYPVFHLSKEDFMLERQLIRDMLSSGFSMGMMMSLVFFGTLLLQSTINTFGTDIIVAHTAARKMNELYFLPPVVLGITMATFCGQNYGAGKYDRVKAGVKYALLLSWSWVLVTILMSYTIGPQLIHMVSGSTKNTVLTQAVLYMKVNAPFFFLASAISITRNTLQAVGDHLTPIVSSAIELVGKVFIAMLLAPKIGYFGIIIAEPIIWFFMLIPLVVKLLRHPVIRSMQAD